MQNHWLYITLLYSTPNIDFWIWDLLIKSHPTAPHLINSCCIFKKRAQFVSINTDHQVFHITYSCCYCITPPINKQIISWLLLELVNILVTQNLIFDTRPNTVHYLNIYSICNWSIYQIVLYISKEFIEKYLSFDLFWRSLFTLAFIKIN